MRASRLPWLTVLAVSVPGARLLIDVAGAIPGRFNDYHAYWLAGRLVAAGGDPYDRAALVELAQREGLEFLVGTGYSYPPPFALLMVPLAALPFDVSAALFSAVSLMAFGIVIAALVQPLRRPAVLAFAAGAYPPVAGSLFIGQANLLVFGLLALGFLFLRQEALVTGLAWGGAAVIKLVPIGLLVPLALARQRQIVLTFLGSVGLYLVLAALAVARTSGGTAAMLTLLEPDSYWTNQSLNGVLTRGLEGTAAADHTSLMVVGARCSSPASASPSCGAPEATSAITAASSSASHSSWSRRPSRRRRAPSGTTRQRSLAYGRCSCQRPGCRGPTARWWGRGSCWRTCSRTLTFGRLWDSRWRCCSRL